MKKNETLLLWIVLVIVLLGNIIPVYAQTDSKVLSVEECRTMALDYNKQLQVMRLRQEVAKDTKNSARMLYMPKVNVEGAYMHTSREVSLLSENQKNTFSNLGTSMSTTLSKDIPGLLTSLASSGILTPAQAQGLLQVAAQSLPQLAQQLNQIGEQVVDAFHTDTRNLWLGGVMLTQPLFTGGKIMAANKIADINRELTANEMELLEHDLSYQVDNAYWLVISLVHKQKLAQGYHDLLTRLESDVQKMISEGVATKSDELSVSVKVNEAEMTLTQVNDGLVLSRMALCQLCGMPVDADIRLEDEQKEELEDVAVSELADMEQVFALRPELKMLENATDIAEQKVKMARANYFPTLALTAGYTLSNPNLYNGFQRKMGGMWNVGVLLSMPLSNIWENKPRMHSAYANVQIYQLKTEDAISKINLQVKQNQFKLLEAENKLKMTQKNTEKANENLRSANVGFEEGVFTATTVMEAQTAWLQAKSQQIDAQIGIRLAASELKKSKGEN